MKKIYLALALMLGVFTVRAAYDNFYLVGGATIMGWTDSKPCDMEKTDTGFTWTGNLYNTNENPSKNNDNELKFLSATGSYDNSIIFTENDLAFELGKEYKLMKAQAGVDNKLKITESGVYKVDVKVNPEDDNDLSVTITKADMFTELYLVGNAADCGFDTGKAIQMTGEAGIFTWEGHLTGKAEGADNPRFKFLVKRDWHPSITCDVSSDVHKEVALDAETDLVLRPNDHTGNDLAFQVAASGEYRITVDLNTYKMTVSALGEIDVPTEPEDKSKLFIIGSAPWGEGAGWDHGKGLPLAKQEEGVFTLTCNLYANGQFKFTNSTASTAGMDNQNVVAAANDQDITNGGTYDLVYRPLQSSPNDYKFKPSKSARYTLTVDLNNMKMSVKEEGEVMVSTVDKTQLFLQGTAFVADESISMKNVSENVFFWQGELQVGSFAFLNKQAEGEGIYPIDDNLSTSAITDAKGVERCLFKDSGLAHSAFSVEEAGEYSIVVNLNNMQMAVDRSATVLATEKTLYAIGGSLEENGEWPGGFANGVAMTETESGIWTLTTTLYTKADNAESDMKFRIANDTWDRCIVLADGQDRTLAVGTTYSLVYRPLNTNNMIGDNKLIVKATGLYRLTIDLNTMTLKVENGEDIGTGMDALDATQCVVLAADGVISVSSATTIQQVAVYDIAGKCVNQLAGVEGRIVLADNLADGLYIVKLRVNGEETTRKVVVK